MGHIHLLGFSPQFTVHHRLTSENPRSSGGLADTSNGFHARYAPGGLYDVPVQQGWLEGAEPKARLNSTPDFM